MMPPCSNLQRIQRDSLPSTFRAPQHAGEATTDAQMGCAKTDSKLKKAGHATTMFETVIAPANVLNSVKINTKATRKMTVIFESLDLYAFFQIIECVRFSES